MIDTRKNYTISGECVSMILDHLRAYESAVLQTINEKDYANKPDWQCQVAAWNDRISELKAILSDIETSSGLRRSFGYTGQ